MITLLSIIALSAHNKKFLGKMIGEPCKRVTNAFVVFGFLTKSLNLLEKREITPDLNRFK